MGATPRVAASAAGRASVDLRRLDDKGGNEQLMSGCSPAAEARRDPENEGTRQAYAVTGRCVPVACACARGPSMRASSDDARDTE
eukprot:5784157-Pleurochrysis_carterae.AAC.2